MPFGPEAGDRQVANDDGGGTGSGLAQSRILHPQDDAFCHSLIVHVASPAVANISPILGMNWQINRHHLIHGGWLS